MITVNQPARLTDLAAELNGQGHEISIYARRESPGRNRTVLAPGVLVDHLPAGPQHPLEDAELLPHLTEFGQQLATHWAIRPPDVLHAHGWQSGLAALSSATEIPMLQSHVHLAGRDTDRQAQARLEGALSRTTAASTVACSQDQDDLAHLGVPRSRIHVIPWGVRLPPLTRWHLTRPNRKYRRLLMLTGPDTGADQAVRALSRIPEAQLVIAGGPEPAALETDPAANRLRLLAKAEAVDDRLLLLGRVPTSHLPRLIRSADLMLALESHDPYAVDVLQAMACGIPALAVRSGGHLDTVLDTVTGILITETAPPALAARMRVLLADPTLLQAMGFAARDRARARHSWSRIASQTHALYQKITARSS
ncbi:glycosyltransferase [Streptosporangiaceae bacterium NEAU-GS5]|nr:glycosyltransferase [Streptosporangiaceae bacterium NEAU-GS5]